MLISIITPTFNSETTILRCVQSVIQQTYPGFEHIIIDNMSTDDTLRLIRGAYEEAGISERLSVISEKDNGISDAFNKGIKNARGDVIGILNSDDEYAQPDSLERIAAPFKDRSIPFVHGNIYFHDPLYGSNIRRPLQCDIHIAMPLNHPTLYMRREIYDKYGIYNPAFKIVMDYELLIRLESEQPGFLKQGVYIGGKPLVIMNAGGLSWDKEAEALRESKKGLQLHGFWTMTARRSYMARRLRIVLKTFFRYFHLDRLIQVWRNRKWKIY